MWQCVGTPKSRYVDFVYATLESGSHASSRRASQTTFVACPALSLGPPPCSHAVSPENSLDQQIIEGCTNCQFAIKVVWSRVQVPPSPQAPSVVRPWRRGDSAARSAAGRGDRLELAVRLMPAPDATRSNATSAGKREVGRGGGSARTGEMNGGGGGGSGSVSSGSSSSSSGSSGGGRGGGSSGGSGGSGGSTIGSSTGSAGITGSRSSSRLQSLGSVQSVGSVPSGVSSVPRVALSGVSSVPRVAPTALEPSPTRARTKSHSLNEPPHFDHYKVILFLHHPFLPYVAHFFPPYLRI